MITDGHRRYRCGVESVAGRRDTRCFIEIGSGVLPIQQIMDAADLPNLECQVLEQDHTAKDEIDSVRTSGGRHENF